MVSVWKFGGGYYFDVFKPSGKALVAREPVFSSATIYQSERSAFAAGRAWLKANQNEVFG